MVLALPAATGATAILRDAAGFAFILVLSHELLTAPLAWYRDAALERRFGLSQPSTSAWLGDYLKSAVILVAGGVCAASLCGVTMVAGQRVPPVSEPGDPAGSDARPAA